MSEGFIDLRLNRQEGQVNESFWPAFTDIMTVVVMIFLIAMVVLLMRNMELVRELRATMEAERVASELAKATGEEKQSLALRLHDAQERISQLQLELMRQRELGQQQRKTITDQQAEIDTLATRRDDLTQRVAQLTLLRERLQTELESARTELATARQQVAGQGQTIANLQQNLHDLQARFQETQERVGQLQQTLADQQLALERDRRQRQEAERRYLVLVGEYDDLKGKYDKLVRPARSAKGRYVVEVRYRKVKGRYRIEYREGSEGRFQSVSRKTLERRLARLKERHPNGLYIKVIIPENSGLSYNEAWSFTSHLHSNYDYYFQEGSQEVEKSPAADGEAAAPAGPAATSP